MMEREGHPATETLKDYAFGALAEGMELLVASHLTFCPQCRKTVSGFEALAAAAMPEAPAGLDAPSLDATLEMLDMDAPPAPRIFADQDSIFPTALQRHVPGQVDEIRWSRRLPGLYECQLDGFEGEKVSLLKALPGTKMLHHTHEGKEATLILQGEMTDGDQVFRRGEVAEADDHDDHRPEITGTETCICLIVMSGNMRFTGAFSRALNVLVR